MKKKDINFVNNINIKEIKDPSFLHSLNYKQLDILASNIRKEIIEQTSINGGHLSSNLGVVELTIALHRSFDLSLDKVIFDVGHQSYTHKIITGRREEFKDIFTLKYLIRDYAKYLGLNSEELTTMESICDWVKEDLDAFVGDAPQFDDITMLVLKFKKFNNYYFYSCCYFHIFKNY